MAAMGPRSAQGAPIQLTLVPDAASVSVPQNTVGTVDFITVTLGQASLTNVGFTSITPLNPLFVSDDDRDTVINPRIGNQGKGAFLPCSTARALNPGGSCVIQLIFDTRDTRVPDPDVIAGVWSETVNVVAFEVVNPNNSQGFTPTVQITVTDPARAPEPVSVSLLGGAAAMLAFWRRRRSPRP
jgi:hypothetical protein